MRTLTACTAAARCMIGCLAFAALGCADPAASDTTEISVALIVAGPYQTGAFELLIDGRSVVVPPTVLGSVVSGLPAGSHTVSLVGVPPGCKAMGTNTSTVDTSPATKARVEFRVSCYSRGAIAVTVNVVGSDTAISVSASIDAPGLLPRTIVKGNTTTVLGDSFEAGTHIVRIVGVPGGCAPLMQLSAAVTVNTFGLLQDTAVANFNIYCGSAAAQNLGGISGTVGDAATGGQLRSAFAEITATPLNGGAETVINRSGDFALTGLYPGRWNLGISGMYGFVSAFPGLHVYGDTTLSVEVKAGQMTVLPSILLKPRSPLLLVSVHTCSFQFPSPPTMEDWGSDSCEGGFWGGARVEIEVAGVDGTPTAGQHFKKVIGDSTGSATWDSNYWSTFFDIAVPGDYDVKVLSVAPGNITRSPVSFRIVPFEQSTTRMSLNGLVGYLNFDFYAVQ